MFINQDLVKISPLPSFASPQFKKCLHYVVIICVLPFLPFHPYHNSIMCRSFYLYISLSFSLSPSPHLFHSCNRCLKSSIKTFFSLSAWYVETTSLNPENPPTTWRQLNIKRWKSFNHCDERILKIEILRVNEGALSLLKTFSEDGLVENSTKVRSRNSIQSSVTRPADSCVWLGGEGGGGGAWSLWQKATSVFFLFSS